MQMFMVLRIGLCRESNREGLRGMYITVLEGFKGEIACTLRVSLTPDCSSVCKHSSCHQPSRRAGHGRINATEEHCCWRSLLTLTGLYIGRSIRWLDSSLNVGLAVCHLR